MIYYKKKSWFKKIKNNVVNFITTNNFKKKNPLSFFKKFLTISSVILLLVYLSYLFLLPIVANEKNIEKAINLYLTKNSKLLIDIEKIKITPNYKFDICINADEIKLKYSTKNNFIILKKPKIEINFLGLFIGNIDINNAKFDSAIINTNFTKQQRYNSFDYLIKKTSDSKNKFKIRNLKLYAKTLDLNIYDENIQKQFKIKAQNSTFEKKANLITQNTPYSIISCGTVFSQNKKINDFELNLTYYPKEQQTKKIKSALEKLSYNPFIYADKYNFYTKSNIVLKINPKDSKNPLSGQIKLNDLTLSTNGIQIPKNNLLLIFKNNKIYTDFNFNLIKNQFIKVKSQVNLSKSKYIELNLNSNKINLEDFHNIIASLSKIFNLKFDLSTLEIKGESDINLYIKSNFKTINSNGNLFIKNGFIKHKKLNLSLDQINSNINFKNNQINIINSSAYFDKSKFNIKGQIDKNTNLNIDINSDLINFSQFINFISNMPLISKNSLKLNDYQINSGYLKIDSSIKGTIKNPIINSNSYLNNLSLIYKPKNINIKIKEIKITPNLNQNKFNSATIDLKEITAKKERNCLNAKAIKLLVLQNEIKILKSVVLIDEIQNTVDGIIKNYSTKNPETILNIESKLNNKNKFLIINNISNPILTTNLLIKKNNLLINSATLTHTNKKIAQVQGEIQNFGNENQILNKIKLTTNETLSIILPIFDNITLDLAGNIEINGKINNPKINGNLYLYKLIYSKLGINIKDILINLKDSICYLNMTNGKIFDFNFDVTSQIKLKDNKLIIDWANISSQYIDFNKIEKYLNNSTLAQEDKIEITNFKGTIQTLGALDFELNSVNFDGSYKNKILTLDKFSAEIFNGKINGNLSTNIEKQQTKINLILKDLNIRMFQDMIKDLSIAASGKLSSLIEAQFDGFDFKTLIQTMNGYIKFNINDGELSQFAKLERLLQAGNILSQSILKLTLNSAISTITKQNTGYFKQLEGTIKIKDSWANIQYLKSQGTNMSFYSEGRFNLLTQYAQMTILGRIPSNIVNVLGNIGSFSTQNLVNKMSQDAKEIVKSITTSPIEKMMTMQVLSSDIEKIPPLVYSTADTTTREFLAKINGNLKNSNSIQFFKWVIKAD